MKKKIHFVLILMILIVFLMQTQSFCVETIDGVIKTQSDIDIYQYMKTQTEMEQNRFVLSLTKYYRENGYIPVSVSDFFNNIKNNNSFCWWFIPQPMTQWCDNSNLSSQKINWVTFQRSNISQKQFLGVYLQGETTQTAIFNLNCNKLSSYTLYVMDPTSTFTSSYSGSGGNNYCPVGLERYISPSLQDLIETFWSTGKLVSPDSTTLTEIEQNTQETNQRLQEQTNTINQQTNTIQQQTQQQQQQYNSFTSNNVNTNDAVIDNSQLGFNDNTGVDSFLQSFLDLITGFLDTTEQDYEINIPMGHNLQPLHFSTAPVTTFYQNNQAIAYLVSTFWYFIIGRYFLAFLMRILNWLRGVDDSGFSVSALTRIMSNYNIIMQDILFM